MNQILSNSLRKSCALSVQGLTTVTRLLFLVSDKNHRRRPSDSQCEILALCDYQTYLCWPPIHSTPIYGYPLARCLWLFP